MQERSEEEINELSWRACNRPKCENTEDILSNSGAEEKEVFGKHGALLLLSIIRSEDFQFPESQLSFLLF